VPLLQSIFVLTSASLKIPFHQFNPKYIELLFTLSSETLAFLRIVIIFIHFFVFDILLFEQKKQFLQRVISPLQKPLFYYR